jgi:oligopeptidase B
MKKFTVMVLLQLLLLPWAFAQDGSGIEPPVAKQIPKITEIHGHRLVDNYFWLREKSNPDVIKYIEAENAYTEAMMKPTVRLQQTLYREMVSRIKQTSLDVPYRQGDYYYYSRTEEGRELRVLCRKKADRRASEEVMLDLNRIAPDGELSLGDFVVSDDGNWLAYSVDTTGLLQFKLYIKDLRTNTLSNETIERVGTVVWAQDNRTIFYTTEDPVDKRSDKFWRHTVGAGQSVLIYEEKDELFDLRVKRSRDKKMILLGSEAMTSSEWRYLTARDPRAELKLLWARARDHQYSADYDGGNFYIRTNKGANNFRVLVAPALEPESWREFIAHNPLVKIEETAFFSGYCVVAEREAGLPHLRVIDLKTNQARRIAVMEPDYSISLDSDDYAYSHFDRNPQYNTAKINYRYQSLLTPETVFEYDLVKGRSRLVKQQEVLGGYDRRRYKAERVWATARDGTRVPLSVVYRKDVKLDGTAPLLMSGYGSYGASTRPSFSTDRLSLLDRGVICARAQVRGGGELGEQWRAQGRMMKKMNTFTDFIDCAEWLIRNRYTSPARLVISGGSAGGLLVGAVANMRPDLFKAVVAGAPFVDCINTMLDPSLPLTTSEYLEWGNPNEKAAFEYIRQYSPYENVRRQSYPAMLVLVSMTDRIVNYWEGTKLVAKLRATKTDNRPLLLKADKLGHGGPTGRYILWRDMAFRYAFILTQMGITK